ncbi:hypothetical protein VTN00DRAFT_3050 [Thermoascus crustaceus]|uniref:uncharacterized protein n=1 Tax=Thermoascus crustaceus TaxID=5088 RepID=UPI0037448D97
MDLINAILECITGNAQSSPQLDKDEKTAFRPNIRRSDEEIANSILSTLFAAGEVDLSIKKQLDETVGAEGWTENIGKTILNGLVNALQQGVEMGSAIKDAFVRATEAAVDFPREHPVYFTIIALGILVILTPWVIEALGFGELGPIEGTFAAWWQARYAGYVPKGSLFSFFQRLGMVWKH